ncbi:TIGR01777 family oxidoreductase [Bacillus kexueae]|uniref:TIGR01777 family oxidoreductase n=1 Tax=Aeribacillus kexueae TaxID=2078952 RepID=UPI001FB04010|nr:TIGR01777 family oxidoreductase [Bacillus kexueae]
MKIAIFGGSGFIGKQLISYLEQQNVEVIVVTRKKTETGSKEVQWLSHDSNPEKELDGCDVFINLAGKTIDSKWTKANKELILNSRINATDEVLHIIEKMTKKPSILINASAIGIYGTSTDEEFTEESASVGNDFLALTVQEWEQRAIAAEKYGVRVVLARFGVVLHKTEGALPKMVLPYRFFAGGTVGSGTQWLSWIHIDDLVRLLSYIIENQDIRGPINVTAPHPVTMKEFGQTLASIIHRPHWVPAPSFALKLLLGEKSILVLEGQKAIPQKAIQHGFSFTYPTIKEALSAIYPNM